MQRNFILTDVMKTGYHVELEQFINMHTMTDQQFETTGEYYSLHNYNLDSYDRRFAIIDVRQANDRLKDNKEFHIELKRRCDLLHSQGFVFIKSNPWESVENINTTPQHPEIEIAHIKWTGGVSWFGISCTTNTKVKLSTLIILIKNMISYILTRCLGHTESNFMISCWTKAY